MTQKNKRGFTLIELLVVISIIGLISSIVLSALSTARAKGRDAQRIQAISEIRKALTLYYDKNGFYPRSSASIYSNDTSGWNGTGVNTLTTALTNYISLPRDPTNTATTFGQIYSSGTNFGYAYGYRPNDLGTLVTDIPTDYDLIARFETSDHPLRCGLKAWVSYALTPGAGWCTTTTSGAIGGSTNLYSDH